MWDKDKKVDHCKEVNNSLTQSTLLVVVFLLICFSELFSLYSISKTLSHTTRRYKPSDASRLRLPTSIQRLVSWQFA